MKEEEATELVEEEASAGVATTGKGGMAGELISHESRSRIATTLTLTKKLTTDAAARKRHRIPPLAVVIFIKKSNISIILLLLIAVAAEIISW